jgi:hypothetical protein
MPGARFVLDVADIVIMGSGSTFRKAGGATRGENLAYIRWLGCCLLEDSLDLIDRGLCIEKAVKTKTAGGHVLADNDDFL